MTDTITARDVLTQAAETIDASFWVKRTELSFSPRLPSGGGWWDNKIIRVKAAALTSPRYTMGGEVAIKGVCSVGAISLARALKGETEIESFGPLSERDLPTYLAAAALAWAMSDDKIFTSQEAVYAYPLNVLLSNPSPSGIIITVNDNPMTTKEIVSAAFHRALEHPVLDATEVWVLEGLWMEHGVTYYLPLVFSSKEAAEAWHASDDKRAAYVREHMTEVHAHPHAKFGPKLTEV